MSIRKLMPRLVAFLILILSLLLIDVKADDIFRLKYSSISLQRALKMISNKFGVPIIADPLLSGVVKVDIQGDSVEAVLKPLLEPMGYSYTKVEDYYLVSGPESPLTILAETESTLIPVGFLDPLVQEQLSDLKQYLSYDESSGVIYVKAPSSRMDAILSKLWQITKTSGELSVAYSLQIIDLGKSSDLDFLFSAAYDGSLPDKNEVTLTPEQWSLDGKVQAILKQKAASYTENINRQPWMITLPGRTVQLRTSFRTINNELDTDRYFTIQLTPIRVDPLSGAISSNVHIDREMVNESNISFDSDVKQVKEQVHKVVTVVQNTPGERAILAAVRQTKENQVKRLWWFGKRKIHEHRDFIVLISATPLNIQSTLAASYGYVPIASLSGFEEWIDDPDLQIDEKPVLEFGLVGTENDNTLKGWFNFKTPVGQLNSLTLDFRNDDRYSLGLSFGLDNETYFKFLAGKGVGPENQDAVMFGVGDTTHPNPYLSLFAEYYPWSYLIDSEETSDDGVWAAGVRLGGEKFGITLGAVGDPDYDDGWLFRLDFSVKKTTLLLEYDHTQESPSLSLGLGLHF